MARGGFRPGAGRKKNQISPSEINNIKARIQSHAIVKRLQAHVAGEVEMSPSAVTAALGLLRKVMPDLAAVEATGMIENIHYAVGEQPIGEDEWAEQHTAH